MCSRRRGCRGRRPAAAQGGAERAEAHLLLLLLLLTTVTITIKTITITIAWQNSAV